MIKAPTLKFLKDLKRNNNKPWFDSHRDAYEDARANMTSLAGELIKAISVFDPPIGSQQAKDCLFRINRDIRFSADKTPYKTNLACYFNKAGKKGNGAGYYLHIEPGESFAAGGIWMPAPADLAKMRQEIDYSFDEWKRIINSTAFKRNFPEGFSNNEKLTRPPKGYDDTNPAIEFIKLKSLVISKSFSDADLQSKDFVKKVAKVFEAIYPVVKFLNQGIEG